MRTALKLLATGCVSVVSAVCSSGAAAQVPPSTLSAPFGQCDAGYWSSTRNLDDKAQFPAATCSVNWKPKITPDIGLGISARAGWHDSLDANRFALKLREVFADFDGDAFSLRLGKQVIAWGRADRINPTDSFSTRDFTQLTSDDEDQRLGVVAAKLRYVVTPVLSITGVVARFSASTAPSGSLPANWLKPSEPIRADWAVKIDRNGDGLDWALSYFDGLERLPRYRLDATQATSPVFVGEYERSQKLGVDFATSYGPWTFRGEASHAKLRCQSCAEQTRGVSRAVVGFDRDFAGTANINLQIFTNRRSAYVPPPLAPGLAALVGRGLDRLNAEYSNTDTGMTIRLSDRLLNEKLKWEIAVVKGFKNGDALIRPRVSYAFSDNVKLTVGFDRYTGPTQSYFGALKKNQLSFLTAGVLF